MYLNVWISIQIFMLVFAVIPNIPQTARLQFRPKPTSSGLDVEAKFYFQN